MEMKLLIRLTTLQILVPSLMSVPERERRENSYGNCCWKLQQPPFKESQAVSLFQRPRERPPSSCFYWSVLFLLGWLWHIVDLILIIFFLNFFFLGSANELITKKKVQVIVGMNKWKEVALVAVIGNKANVPVLSFAAPAITSTILQHRWPFLIQMANSDSA